MEFPWVIVYMNSPNRFVYRRILEKLVEQSFQSSLSRFVDC